MLFCPNCSTQLSWWPLISSRVVDCQSCGASLELVPWRIALTQALALAGASLLAGWWICFLSFFLAEWTPDFLKGRPLQTCILGGACFGVMGLAICLPPFVGRRNTPRPNPLTGKLLPVYIIFMALLFATAAWFSGKGAWSTILFALAGLSLVGIRVTSQRER